MDFMSFVVGMGLGTIVGIGVTIYSLAVSDEQDRRSDRDG